AVVRATNSSIDDILRLPVGIEFLSELLSDTKPSLNADYLYTAHRLFRAILAENSSSIKYLRLWTIFEISKHCIGKQIPYLPPSLKYRMSELSLMIFLAMPFTLVVMVILTIAKHIISNR